MSTNGGVAVLRADARELPLTDESVDLIVTSPPYYGLRSYTDGGEAYPGQLGMEATPAAYLTALTECTREWVRVLKPGGSLFVNMGDRYAGAAPGPRTALSPRGGGLNGQAWCDRLPGIGDRAKSLLGLPWRYALACTDQLGLTLRAEIIWSKPNGLPESVTDRVRRAHEQVFHFTRTPRYFAAVDEIREPGQLRNCLPGGGGTYRAMKAPGAKDTNLATATTHPLGALPDSVWTIPSAPLAVPPRLGVDHFAAFPPALVRPIVLGWSPAGICTECGEGLRPVVAITSGTFASESERQRLSVQQRERAAIGGGSVSSLGRKGVGRTITSYLCACTKRARPGMPAGTSCETVSRAGLPPTRPAVVLDPFGGTGTTALTASVLGRHGITVDRSADYCRIAAWRTADPGERARALGVPKPPPVPDGQAALFPLGELAP
jgi:DNA modification methylase